MQREVRIDFERIQEHMLVGARRAAVFLGLGVNAARDPEFTAYGLTDIADIQLIRSNHDEATVRSFKREFESWIAGNGLRELLEAFAHFLDQIFEACLTVQEVQGNKRLPAREALKKFEGERFPNKLCLIHQNFQIAPERPSFLISLQRARNCLTHRRGVVGPKDCKGSDSLVVNWRGIDVVVREPTGAETHINTAIKERKILKDGGDVLLRFVDRERRFSRGDVLRVEPRDLAEICWYVVQESKRLTDSAIGYAKSTGVQIGESKQGI